MSQTTKQSNNIQKRAAEALAFVEQIERDGKSWVEAHNAFNGVGGKAAELFPTRAERTAFLKTPEHARIREIFERLPRNPAATESAREEPSGKLLVRLPKTLHAALRDEAQAEGVSLNQLIVAKLSMQLRAIA